MNKSAHYNKYLRGVKELLYRPRIFLCYIILVLLGCNCNVTTQVNDETSAFSACYDDYLAAKAAILQNDAVVKKDKTGDCFFFITDTHFQNEYNNAGNSGKLIDYLASNTSFDKIIHGGDSGGLSNEEGCLGYGYIMQSIEWFKERLLKYVTKYGFLNVHGNHDYNNFFNIEGTDFRGLSIPMVRKYILGSNTLPFVTDEQNPNGIYYYYDNDASKLRYIIVDSEQDSETGRMYMDNLFQLAWIVNSIKSLPPNYDLVFITHCPIEVTVDITGEYQVFSNLLTLIRAVNNHRKGVIGGIDFDFTNSQCKVVMVLSGHTHMDNATLVDNVLHVTTKCDKMDTTYPMISPFDIWAERIRGTYHEQAFDAITIYNSHSDIQFRRIGDGHDRLFHTKIKKMAVGETIDLSLMTEIKTCTWVTNDCTGNTYSSELGWTLSNTILSVDTSGNVTALSPGEAFVIAKDVLENKEFFYIKVID